MEIKKVHKILEFKQSYWMGPYIMNNTKLKTKATIFRRIYINSINNAVFGKTMEHVANCVNIKLRRTSDEEKIKT